jgi:hypothetical protein
MTALIAASANFVEHYRGRTMLELSWRLVGQGGEIRRQAHVTMPSMAAIWRELTAIADTFGRPGEVLQVFEPNGDMIIRVGVATARSAAA